MAEAAPVQVVPAAAAPAPVVKEEKESAPVKPKEAVAEGADKKLCTYSKKPCAQRRMDGYAHCVKHILEDPTAPFAQCEHVAKNTSKRCSLPVPLKEPEPRYCSSHKQALGLVPSNKKSPAKRDRSKKATPGSGKPLITVLKKAGILHSPHYLPRMTEGEDSESASSVPDDSDGEHDAPLSSSDSEEEAAYDPFLAEATADEPDVDLLKDSAYVTEEELVRRRQVKVKRLLKLYKTQFTRLRAVLKLKHRHFLREKQRRSEAAQRKEQAKDQPKEAEGSAAAKEKAALRDKLAASYHTSKVSKAVLEKPTQRATCAAEGCTMRCMPPTKYCYAHILHDTSQKLFKGCSYVRADGQPCNYPVLIAQELCPAHQEKEQRDGAKKEPRKRKAPKDKDGEGAKEARVSRPKAAAAPPAAAPPAAAVLPVSVAPPAAPAPPAAVPQL